MKERPILFSGEMVRAILEGRKTQTRRMVKPVPPDYIDRLHGNALRKRAPYEIEHSDTGMCMGYGFCDDNNVNYICKYGQPGDRLWVKETFGICSGIEPAKPKLGHKIYYRSTLCAKDGSPSQDKGIADGWPVSKWRPSIFMPRFASRITLEIVSVRVERLQEISEEDAKAEGTTPFCGDDCAYLPVDLLRSTQYLNVPCYRIGYFQLWESINGKGSWDENPFVWVIEFKRLTVE